MNWQLCFLIPLLSYSFLVLLFFVGWKKLHPFNKSQGINNKFITIVIAARNEEKNIGLLLNDLQLQSYPSSQFEIILVNDHSNDLTKELAKTYLKRIPNLRIIDLPETHHGKKQALKFGITGALGELILTTDADCRLGQKWVETVVEFYAHCKADLIIGPVLYYNERNWFEHMQSLEIMSLVASGAGSAGIEMPILCNGSNLAFRKDLYIKSLSGLQPSVASGDDMFLLQFARNETKAKISFLKSREALVTTKAVGKLNDFLNQRKRWTSKSRYYKHFFTYLVAATVFFVSFIMLVLFVTSLMYPKYGVYFLTMFVIKSLADLPLLLSFSHFFSKKSELRYFLITQFVYPLHIVFTAIYGNFGRFEWKNRWYK